MTFAQCLESHNKNRRPLTYTGSRVHTLVMPLPFNRIIVFRLSATTCAIRTSRVAPYGVQTGWTTSYDRSRISTQLGTDSSEKSIFYTASRKRASQCDFNDELSSVWTNKHNFLFYGITNRCDNVQWNLFLCKYTLHVSGGTHAYHQEYNFNCINSHWYNS